ncbi:MAG: type II restriction endonuclease [Methylocystis sp.]|nr:type II restriction endonuclease [Methylocystis sp.]MCA3585957.1 type II restriction endonuclease [Methylocystis sp.]MCA3586411.1 type II restriction endonuclease [Methylocystis sp.]MCA3592898.1 type II restriction endonuclease [Methylocystis sp.]
MSGSGLMSKARLAFHEKLVSEVLFIHSVSADKAKNSSPLSASNADDDSQISRQIASSIASQIGARAEKKVAGQTAGNLFEIAVTSFLESSLGLLNDIRPGHWHVRHVGGRSGIPIAEFEQFSHLAELSRALKKDRTLNVLMGNSYSISPDIVVFRDLLPDEKINQNNPIVDGASATRADIRASSGGKKLLHASVSCKWTMRSDRAQNARSEALNLIRNRKGRTPHIAVVVGEPLPSRIASLALGTGEFDCLYHFALYELQAAVKKTGEIEALNMLEDLVNGKRLKDISDLPLDLAI